MSSFELTKKQKLFCQQYIIDNNTTAAAIRAGYNTATAEENGRRNCNNPNIQRYVRSLKSDISIVSNDKIFSRAKVISDLEAIKARATELGDLSTTSKAELALAECWDFLENIPIKYSEEAFFDTYESCRGEAKLSTEETEYLKAKFFALTTALPYDDELDFAEEKAKFENIEPILRRLRFQDVTYIAMSTAWGEWRERRKAARTKLVHDDQPTSLTQRAHYLRRQGTSMAMVYSATKAVPLPQEYLMDLCRPYYDDPDTSEKPNITDDIRKLKPITAPMPTNREILQLEKMCRNIEKKSDLPSALQGQKKIIALSGIFDPELHSSIQLSIFDRFLSSAGHPDLTPLLCKEAADYLIWRLWLHSQKPCLCPITLCECWHLLSDLPRAERNRVSREFYALTENSSVSEKI